MGKVNRNIIDIFSTSRYLSDQQSVIRLFKLLHSPGFEVFIATPHRRCACYTDYTHKITPFSIVLRL